TLVHWGLDEPEAQASATANHYDGLVLEAHRPGPVFVSAELGRSGARKRVTVARAAPRFAHAGPGRGVPWFSGCWSRVRDGPLDLPEHGDRPQSRRCRDHGHKSPTYKSRPTGPSSAAPTALLRSKGKARPSPSNR